MNVEETPNSIPKEIVKIFFFAFASAEQCSALTRKLTSTHTRNCRAICSPYSRQNISYVRRVSMETMKHVDLSHGISAAEATHASTNKIQSSFDAFLRSQHFLPFVAGGVLGVLREIPKPWMIYDGSGLSGQCESCSSSVASYGSNDSFCSNILRFWIWPINAGHYSDRDGPALIRKLVCIHSGHRECKGTASSRRLRYAEPASQTNRSSLTEFENIIEKSDARDLIE